MREMKELDELITALEMAKEAAYTCARVIGGRVGVIASLIAGELGFLIGDAEAVKKGEGPAER